MFVVVLRAPFGCRTAMVKDDGFFAEWGRETQNDAIKRDAEGATDLHLSHTTHNGRKHNTQHTTHHTLFVSTGV